MEPIKAVRVELEQVEAYEISGKYIGEVIYFENIIEPKESRPYAVGMLKLIQSSYDEITLTVAPFRPEHHNMEPEGPNTTIRYVLHPGDVVWFEDHFSTS